MWLQTLISYCYEYEHSCLRDYRSTWDSFISGILTWTPFPSSPCTADYIHTWNSLLGFIAKSCLPSLTFLSGLHICFGFIFVDLECYLDYGSLPWSLPVYHLWLLSAWPLPALLLQFSLLLKMCMDPHTCVWAFVTFTFCQSLKQSQLLNKMSMFQFWRK